MFTSAQAPPPAYLTSSAPPPPPGSVTYYTASPHQPATNHTNAYHTGSNGGTVYTTLGAPTMQAFSISPSAQGVPAPVAMGSSGTVLVAPTALLAASGGGAPPGLSTSGGGGSFAANSSSHSSFHFPGSMPLSSSNTNAQGTTFRNLKVGGLPPTVTDSDLYELFQRFGKIESAKVMLNVHTCESRGYGFVLYDTQEAGCRAFGEMNGKTFTLRGVQMTLDVKNSDWDGRQAVIEINSIYVRNIPSNLSDDDLKKYFVQFGNVVALTTRTTATTNAPAPTLPSVALPAAVTPNSAVTQPMEGSTDGGSGGARSASQEAPTIEQQLHSMLDEDEADEARTSASSTEHRVSPPPSTRSAQAASLSADPPTFASFDFTNEPLGKLAMVEFQNIESARLAIAATHRQSIFPNASTPVLSKFADAPHVKEQRRNQRKNMIQPVPVNALTTAPPQPPLNPQQQYVTVVGSANSFPSMSLSGNMPPVAMPLPRYPEAAPLPVPLPRPGTTQRVYYQGVLGLTSDGTLYPIRPDVCVPVAAAGGNHHHHNHHPHPQQQHSQHVAPYHTPANYAGPSHAHQNQHDQYGTAVVET